MRTFGSFLTSILVLAILVGIGWGILQGVKFLIGQYNLLDTELAGTMVIVSVLLLVCTFLIAGAIRYTKLKGDNQVHPEKAYIYTDFISYYITIRESIHNEGVINFRFRSDMVLWAGKNVLKNYTLFNKYLDELNPDNPRILEQAEKVIVEMRKELGQDTFNFKTGELDKLIFVSTENENTQTKKIKTS